MFPLFVALIVVAIVLVVLIVADFVFDLRERARVHRELETEADWYKVDYGLRRHSGWDIDPLYGTPRRRRR